MNRHNLQKLADYLWALPDDYEGFGMAEFHSASDTATVEHLCGSVACAVGHGPSAGVEAMDGESWLQYCERVFIESQDGDEWGWCFACGWSSSDDTAKGAAKRIYYLLENGFPKEWLCMDYADMSAIYANQQPVKA